MSRSIIRALLIVLLLITPIFADDVSDVLSIYDIYEQVDIEKEQTTLNSLLNEYYTLSKTVSNIEMSQIASTINQEQYPMALALQENVVMQKETALREIERLILTSCEGSVEDLLTLEAEYLKEEMNLGKAKQQLEQLRNEKSDVPTENANVSQLKSDLKRKNSRVISQKTRLEIAASFPEIGESVLKSYPLDAYSYITSDFGARTDPIGKTETQYHAGLDLHADLETKVLAAYNGTVEKAGFDEALGYYVQIDHGKGLKTIYGHLSSYIVNIGDLVKQYDHIAFSGNSGSRSTGPHLHFGVYIYGKPVDPKMIITVD